MEYLDNFCTNLYVKYRKKDWKQENYKNIAQAQEIKEQTERLNGGIKQAVDHINSNIKSINSANSKIDNIDDVVEKLVLAVKETEWPKLTNLIKSTELEAKITNNNKTINGNLKDSEVFDPSQDKNDDDKINNNEASNILSQTDILAFCGKLLDILKNGDIPFQNQSDKYEYLKQYFEVKTDIDDIQNTLLVREILHREDNKNKSNENGLHTNDKQATPKQQEELELVINANYLAFQSSIQDYKQLKKEIDDIKLQLKKITDNNAINENQDKENNNAIDENPDEENKIDYDKKIQTIIKNLKTIERKIKQNTLEHPESTLKNNYNEFYGDVYKKTLETKKHLLTKQLELCILKNCIEGQIKNFNEVFFCDKYDTRIFEMEKSNIANSINSVGVKYLSKMNNLIQANEYLNKNVKTEISNMNKQIECITNNIYNNNAKAHTTAIETGFLDSLCCRICAEEPITYTSKNINSMENIGNILTKFKSSKSINNSINNNNYGYNYNNKKYKRSYEKDYNYSSSNNGPSNKNNNNIGQDEGMSEKNY